MTALGLDTGQRARKKRPRAQIPWKCGQGPDVLPHRSQVPARNRVLGFLSKRPLVTRLAFLCPQIIREVVQAEGLGQPVA